MTRELNQRAKLSFNLDLVDLCETGFWFCTRCQKVTERADGHDGNLGGCIFCSAIWSLKWCPPVEGFKISPAGERTFVLEHELTSQGQPAPVGNSVEFPYNTSLAAPRALSAVVSGPSTAVLEPANGVKPLAEPDTARGVISSGRKDQA